MRILYVNAMVCPLVGEIFKRGILAGVKASRLIQSGTGIEVKSINCFYDDKSPARLMGVFARDWQADAVILSGSEKNITDREDPWVREYRHGLYDLLQLPDDIQDWMGPVMPILGICFGHQALADALGGEVARFSRRADLVSVRALHQARRHSVFRDLVLEKTHLDMMVTHSDHVIRLPRGFHSLFTSDYCDIQGMAHDRWPIVSLQSHPEITSELKKNPDDFEDWKHLSDEAMDAHCGPQILAHFADWAAAGRRFEKRTGSAA